MFPVNGMDATFAFLQTEMLGTELAVGVGFTVIVNVSGVPGQVLAVGVTVMVAVTGTVPVFTALNEAIFPLPLAAKPMEGALFVQAKDVPATGPAKFTAAVGAPLHKVWFPTAFTDGVGFTVIVNTIGVPGHPLAVGVTVIVDVIAVVPPLVAVNAGIFTEPLAPKPMAVLLFVQL